MTKSSETDCIVSVFDESINFKGGDTFSSFKNNKTELESLIDILKRGIAKKEPGIKYIKYPNLLIDALEELNGLIGLHRLKDSIALQTVQLIERMKAGEKSMAMLNAMLSGPPGVGKTKASVILAKIWFALGFLDSGTAKTTLFENVSSTGNDMTGMALLVLAFGGTYIIQILSFLHNKMGLFWLSLVLGFFILVLLILYWGNTNTIHKYFYKKEENLENLSDRDIISVVSRNDFVGEYLGHTAGKTKKLLEANIGKVLFIDEAYSLINDARDAYGYECLNTLNLFLSENPDKIVVIFAGYKEQMKASIFAAQPGLERRIMWRFNLDIYSGEELADIFFLQAETEGWSFSTTDREKIRKLIMRNESAFPAYGGDTSRLLYLSSLESSRSNLSEVKSTFLSSEAVEKKKTLSYRDVELGLVSLKENSSF